MPFVLHNQRINADAPLDDVFTLRKHR